MGEEVGTRSKSLGTDKENVTAQNNNAINFCLATF